MTTTELRPDEPDAGPRNRGSRLLLVAILAGMLIGALVSLGLGPRTPTLGTAQTGDTELAEDVRASLVSDRGLQVLSVGRVRDGPGQLRRARPGGGATPTAETRFELGSITKTFTGLLLADAVERGELALDDQLADHLPELRGTAAGDVTLEQLATHRSGLPGVPARDAPGQPGPDHGQRESVRRSRSRR